MNEYVGAQNVDAQVLGSYKIAVLIPCYNESVTITKVIEEFHRSLPQGKIYVYDNNSTDDTAMIARHAGAVIRSEPLQGKGNVVRRMFRDIDADYYVLVDGDDTYDPRLAPGMVLMALQGSLDLINCEREESEQAAYRLGHRLGNRLINGLVRSVFGNRVNDILSGYKVFSRRFVKSFPALSSGFDIETELVVHALELSMPVANVKGFYRSRAVGSESKLHTVRDGIRILWMITSLFKHERPMKFFLIIGLAIAGVSLLLGIPVVVEYLHTGLVRRFPTAMLSMGIMILAFMSFVTGLILDTVTRGRREARMLVYLQHQVYSSEETVFWRSIEAWDPADSESYSHKSKKI